MINSINSNSPTRAETDKPKHDYFWPRDSGDIAAVPKSSAILDFNQKIQIPVAPATLVVEYSCLVSLERAQEELSNTSHKSTLDRVRLQLNQKILRFQLRRKILTENKTGSLALPSSLYKYRQSLQIVEQL